MRIAILDPFSGISGDMTLGALLGVGLMGGSLGLALRALAFAVTVALAVWTVCALAMLLTLTQ